MKCTCGLEHRIEITENSFQDYERDDFIVDFPWALTKNGSPIFECMFVTSIEVELPYLKLIAGSFENEYVAYAVVNYEKREIIYLQRKVETDRARFGFHNEIMEHLINGTLKGRDILTSSPFDFSQPMLRRFGFEPVDPNNPRGSWIRRK